MTRNIFSEIPKEMQQGCIFNGAVVNGFEYNSVYGLIITPRCDIAQKKVKTVHYVPIVDFDEWQRSILVSEFQDDQIEKKKRILDPILTKVGMSHLLNVIYKVDEDKLEKLLFGKDVSKANIGDLIKYWNFHDLDYCIKGLKSWKKYDNRISELVSGKMERYLLLEDWTGKNNFKVIFLTEINKLQFDTARRLINGIKVRDIDFEKNELKQDDNLSIYRIEGCISSPYMEYVGQRLSNALFRIGIEDWWTDNKTICE